MNSPTQTPPLINGQTFAQASQGMTDRGQLGALAQQFQAVPITNPGTQPTINPGVIGTQPLAVPPPVPSNTASTALQTGIDKTFTGTQTQGKDGSVVTTYADGTTNAPITPDGQRQSFADQLKGVFTQLGTKGAETARIQGEEGVQAKKDAVRTIENQALALDNSFKKQQDALLGNGAMTREQAAPQAAELQRMYNSQKADLAIQHQVAQGDYQSAFEIAQAKVDAEFAPLQTQVDSLKAQIDLFQNDMTDSEKEKAQEAYQTQKDALDFEKQKELAALSHKYNLSEIYARSADSSNDTLNGKPQNASQSAAQSYGNRLNEANITLDSLASKFTGAGTAVSNFLGGFSPNFLKSGDRQAVEQAQKNFVTAVLRRESGASIAPSEFKDAASIYFPQPGDTQATIAQKALTRNLVINNFYREANVARPILPGQVIQANDGKMYKVGADGQSIEPVAGGSAGALGGSGSNTFK